MRTIVVFALCAMAVAAGCTTYPTEVRYPTQTAVHPVYGYVDPPIYVAPPVIYGPSPLFWGGAFFGHRHYYGHRPHWGHGHAHRGGHPSSGVRGGSIRGRPR